MILNYFNYIILKFLWIQSTRTCKKHGLLPFGHQDDQRAYTPRPQLNDTRQTDMVRARVATADVDVGDHSEKKSSSQR